MLNLFWDNYEFIFSKGFKVGVVVELNFSVDESKGSNCDKDGWCEG